jgi:hypothetical protein
MPTIKFTSRLKFPNPLSPSAIEFTSPGDSIITLKLFDERGNELKTILKNQPYTPGVHRILLDPLNLETGKYFYRFTVQGKDGEVIETKMFERMV